MRRTRILATIGPACADHATIAALLAAGTDAFRLNFSHGTIETHAEACRRIRDIAGAARRDVAILQDLSGPKIRIGPIDHPIDLADGSDLVIAQGEFAGKAGRVSAASDALFTSVRTGHTLLLDDGRIELTVTGVAPGEISTRVVAGGRLEAHKGINVPGVALRTSALTPKDIEDLRAGVAMGVDLVALSFVQSADDVRAAKAAAASAGAPDMPIIAKIEKPQAVEHLDDILQVADGLMVARGDLGIEMPLETLPAVQKRLILAARRRGIPVIVATQVLESMREEPRPTRAEVTDAAHAVDEGADAIMLAGETAVGRYPVKAVSTLDAIIREAEKALATTPGRSLYGEDIRLAVPDGHSASIKGDHGRALCEAAVTLAERARATAIVAVTGAGKTARMLAALRPGVRILAVTPTVKTAARLALVWGVTPVTTEGLAPEDVRETLIARALVPAGATVVFVSMHPVLSREGTNFVRVERL
ncbi:MAG TPA: pyruvate kinase [Vicinamibacterales bacterium]|nr:pyruvate kinase [Vicinamibacterales bacterium]